MPADHPPVIRPVTAADGPAVAALRAVTWRAAYAGIIDPRILARVTAPGAVPGPPPPYRSTLVAAAGADAAVAGFASYGPERGVLPPSRPAAGPPPPSAGPFAAFAGELTPAGAAGVAGELYALYVTPDAWSTGLGRALMQAATEALRAAGYRRMVLWVLTANARARRFYAQAGLAPDGAVNVLTGLGGVEEVRYARDL